MDNDNKGKDVSKDVTPTPSAPGTATITLPEGMTVDQFNRLFGTFNKQRDYTAKRDKVVREALTDLRKEHPADYDRLLNAGLKKAGLPVK